MQALSTHQNTYQVMQLYYGKKVASSIFHQFIDQIVNDLLGTVAYFNDILIQGDTIKTSEKHFWMLLQRLREKILRVNPKKCKFFETKIDYLGHTISKEGLCKSTTKINAVINALTPTNVDEVRQFLELVNYYHRFILGSSTFLYPLNQLLYKNIPFSLVPSL